LFEFQQRAEKAAADTVCRMSLVYMKEQQYTMILIGKFKYLIGIIKG